MNATIIRHGRRAPRWAARAPSRVALCADPVRRAAHHPEADGAQVQRGRQARHRRDADARVHAQQPAPDTRRGDGRRQRGARRHRRRDALRRDCERRVPSFSSSLLFGVCLCVFRFHPTPSARDLLPPSLAVRMMSSSHTPETSAERQNSPPNTRRASGSGSAAVGFAATPSRGLWVRRRLRLAIDRSAVGVHAIGRRAVILA